MQSDMDVVAGRHGAGRPEHLRPVGVPAHSIAASKHGEWAQHVESRRCLLEPAEGVLVFRACRRLQLRIGADEPRPDPLELPTDIKAFERQTQRSVSTFALCQASRECLTQRMRKLCCVAPAQGHAAVKASKSRPRLKTPEARQVSMESAVHRGGQAVCQTIDGRNEVVLAGHDQFRCG